MDIFKSIENLSAKLYERKILKGIPFDPLPPSPQEKPETEEDPHVKYLGADAIPSSELKGVMRMTIPDEQKNSDEIRKDSASPSLHNEKPEEKPPISDDELQNPKNWGI